ncbi:AAA family ATPase [Nocardia huaxiensis]|uniref:AAA family ATPase n=1 Tax=Nocardia huaxiensis TaxID=2755382 RepID=UPI001E36DC65|nr:SMC family ATPase [Nocardia huaxiensis]UFS93530.1 SMC family ATPase [Nocardia huaxiensis]
MRLHRLELTAFGPFADTAVVDFDELGADGLFLLHGQTGAGKTTVLDAIAFALYGSVPGARAESKRLHSDHADEQTPPRVSLEATIGGRRLRLIRTPEFQRPSKRAKTGWVKENASATLEWLDGRGQNLARIPDIGDEVLRLLGMSADQFFQVVLLPQGDFARFLRAHNEEREKLLEKLFDTERFGTAEQWLVDKRRAGSADLDSRKQSIDRLIAQVGVAAGLPATETAGILESVDWSQRLLAGARATVASTSADLEQRQADSARVRASAESLRALHELHRRRTLARTRLADFHAGAVLRESLAAELALARRAEPVATALAEARAAATTLRRREGNAVRAAEQLAARLLQPASAELDGTAWAAQDLASEELATTDLAIELEALEPVPEPGSGRVPRETTGMAAVAPRRDPRFGDSDPNGTARGAEGSQSQAIPTPDGSRWSATGSASGPEVSGAGSCGVGSGEPAGLSAVVGDAVVDRGTGRRVGGLDVAVRVWSAQIGALDEVRADATAAAELTGELARLRAEQAALAAQLGELRRRRDAVPEALVGVQVRLRAATDAKAGLAALEVECERLRTAAKAVVELERRRAELAGATAGFESARAAHLDARERTLALREQRLAGMAAELAAALVAGEPCSVCGSADHPAPATATAQAVSKEAEEAALAVERRAEAARERAGQQVAELERIIEVLVERGGDADKAELAAALNDSTNRQTEARELAGAVDALTAEFERLRADETRVQDELRKCESRSSATMERIVAADRRLAELTERLRAAAGADGAVDRRRARLETLVSEAAALREARTEVASARDQVAALALRVEKLSYEAGLVESAPPVMGENGPDYTVLAEYARAVDAASRTAQQQADIEAKLAEAEGARAHAEAVLAEPEIQAVADADPGDLEAAESAVAQAQSALESAVAAHAEAARRVEQLEDLCSQLWAAVDRIAPLQRAHNELSRLADVVSGRGENNRRMSLRSYVLAARLEEVALAGSVRLRRMSGGRYEFVHTDAAGSYGRRGGLGLDIRDDYTGAIRPAKTLSGGETFMASLALALGLADVVSAEAGGLVMDTLFIDEGFGSLDADTLDAVMGVLDELRSGGRVVGVVSHVDEMRQRIPSRLHVIRGRNGSRLETTVA